MVNTTTVRIALGIEEKACETCAWAENERGDGCNYRNNYIRTAGDAVDKCLMGALQDEFCLWAPRSPKWKPRLRRFKAKR